MVPRFLSTGFKYVEIPAFTDVQQVIDAAVALVTSPTDPSSGWTRFTLDGNGYYCSPITSLLVPQFKFKLTRSTQYRLTLQCRGANDVTLAPTNPNCSLQIPANPCSARVFAGDGQFCIDITTYTTNGETVWCGSLDQTPDVINFPGINTAWCMGSRRDSDFARQYSTWSYVTLQQGDDQAIMQELTDMHRVSGGGNGPARNLSGSLIYWPRELFAKVRGDTGVYGVGHWIGRSWQIILVPDTGMVPGSKFYCPIDAGVLGQFYSLVGLTTAYGRIPAIRIG